MIGDMMAVHELIGIDATGSRCSCGPEKHASFLEHLAVAALDALGVAPAHDQNVASAVSDLEVTRQVLAAQEAWNVVVGEAMALHFDVRTASYADIADWFARVPAYLPASSAARWLRTQQAQARWRPGPVIDPEKQLAIALASRPTPIRIDDFLATRRVIRKASA